MKTQLYRQGAIFTSSLLLMSFVVGPAQVLAGGLRIVSPSNGTIVEPGQPFTVVVDPEPGVAPKFVALMSQPIMALKEQPPFTFSVSYPPDTPLGPKRLIADGLDAGESPLEAEITLQVETATPVSSIRVEPVDIFFSSSRRRSLSVTGTFTDGQARIITKSRESAYVSSNVQVVTVTPDGLVEAAGEGTATITVTYKGKSATVAIKAEFERRSIKIDVLPGIFPNRINVDSQGVIHVGILTAQGFDATRVDPLSVRFGPNGSAEVHGLGHVEDVDSDGVLDMVLHFSQPDTGIHCLLRQAVLTGATIDGVLIRGVDSVLPHGKLCG